MSSPFFSQQVASSFRAHGDPRNVSFFEVFAQDLHTTKSWAFVSPYRCLFAAKQRMVRKPSIKTCPSSGLPGSRLQNFQSLLMDKIHFAPPDKPWNDDSQASINQPWFPMASKWCETDFVHPRYVDTHRAHVIIDMGVCEAKLNCPLRPRTSGSEEEDKADGGQRLELCKARPEVLATRRTYCGWTKPGQASGVSWYG